MINKTQFSTDPGLLAKGGLLICGKNWGGDFANPDIEEASEPWAPYFSHPKNCSRYQSYILKWFEKWGWKLNPDNPTLLDLAILQTNLFFTQSNRFRGGLDQHQWDHAFQRLCEAITGLDISGLMITSKEVGDKFMEFSSKRSLPQWDRAIGTCPTWTSPTNDTLQLVIARTKVLNIAIMNHPVSGVADADVASESNSEAMHAWISEVFQRYKVKQLAG